jgi:hypothetical protein
MDPKLSKSERRLRKRCNQLTPQTRVINVEEYLLFDDEKPQERLKQQQCEES